MTKKILCNFISVIPAQAGISLSSAENSKKDSRLRGNDKLFFSLILLSLAGCQAISDGADSLGSHLPTIGEPCYHWQCFTAEGRGISDQNKAIEDAEAKIPMTKTAPWPAPAAATKKPTAKAMPSPAN